MWGIVGKCVFLHRILYYKVKIVQFIGSNDAKVDSKGRVFFPASFRKAMQEAGEDGMVMRKDVFQNCLVIYPESVWKVQLTQLRRKLSRWNAREQMIFRQFVADVEVLMPDSNGRVLLPKRYRELTGIVQDVRFIGMADTIELWAREKIEASFMDSVEFGQELELLMTDDALEDNTANNNAE